MNFFTSLRQYLPIKRVRICCVAGEAETLKIYHTGGPRLLHLALSLAVTFILIAADAASRADVLDASAIEYAALQKSMVKHGVTPPAQVPVGASQTMASLSPR